MEIQAISSNGMVGFIIHPIFGYISQLTFEGFDSSIIGLDRPFPLLSNFINPQMMKATTKTTAYSVNGIHEIW